MNPLAEVWLVARRELARIRSRMFVVVTALMMVLVAGLLVLAKLLGGSSAQDVGFVSAETARLVTSVSPEGSIEAVTVPSRAEGERRVRDGDLDALVLDAPLRLVVKSSADDTLRVTLVALARQAALDAELARADVDPGPLHAAVAAADVPVVSLEGAEDGLEKRLALSIGMAVILFIVLQTSGLLVAQGVVEEKASRVVELLLSAVRPWRLMAGKVVGLGIVGLLQMGLVIAAGVVAQVATGAFDLSTGDVLGTAAWSIVWFLVGYAIYSLLYAAAATTVSRQEEIGGVTAPIQILLILAYMMAFVLLPADPHGTAARAASYLPFFSPILMPVRDVLGAAWWEQLAALVPALLTIALLVWVSGRVYRHSVLHTGGRIAFKDAFRGR
ncbi:ABC transporter permease [Actinocorallia sp. API 0066]|uniref:ABC transporter permease n=1 Tax=Actinocorallia sp. API 0066 TaxID=2896846 RepID=UPI001E3E8E04|nr:ABC transporter permease [Actinocorallia sp. API 0066]MCD0448938.1 ABC transporter permease [Actinocorallia sp. API 0066]